MTAVARVVLVLLSKFSKTNNTHNRLVVPKNFGIAFYIIIISGIIENIAKKYIQCVYTINFT